MTLFHFIYTQTMCHNRYKVILIINAIKLPKLQKMIKNKPTKQNICHKKKNEFLSHPLYASSRVCLNKFLTSSIQTKTFISSEISIQSNFIKIRFLSLLCFWHEIIKCSIINPEPKKYHGT